MWSACQVLARARAANEPANRPKWNVESEVAWHGTREACMGEYQACMGSTKHVWVAWHGTREGLQLVNFQTMMSGGR